MKHSAWVVILGVIFGSCTKTYNCKCTTTVNYVPNGQDIFKSEAKPMNEKMTAKQAKAVCDHEAKSVNATYVNVYTNNGTQSYQGVSNINTNCLVE